MRQQCIMCIFLGQCRDGFLPIAGECTNFHHKDKRVSFRLREEEVTAQKKDNGKPSWELLPIEATEGMIKVLDFGKEKYSAHNWREGFDWSRLIGSAFRHLCAFTAGEDIDPESGLSHIDHLMCNAAFLSTHIKQGLGTDDRYKRGEKIPPLKEEADYQCEGCAGMTGDGKCGGGGMNPGECGGCCAIDRSLEEADYQCESCVDHLMCNAASHHKEADEMCENCAGFGGCANYCDKEPDLPSRWTTKDGRVLDIRDMSTNHIENCMALLKRKAGTAEILVETFPSYEAFRLELLKRQKR